MRGGGKWRGKDQQGRGLVGREGREKWKEGERGRRRQGLLPLAGNKRPQNPPSQNPLITNAFTPHLSTFSKVVGSPPCNHQSTMIHKPPGPEHQLIFSYCSSPISWPTKKRERKLYTRHTYWVGQKVHSGLSITSQENTQMAFLANPIHVWLVFNFFFNFVLICITPYSHSR